MPVTPYQNAVNTWNRRASVFRNAGVPDSTWAELYKRDMAGVMNGGQQMTDAEVYAGVVSAVKGPQIKDPEPLHGGHGFFSTVGDLLGNIPHDISDIITGFPAGIAHTVQHLPSELTNTGELIAHLAEGDNKWLTAKGYLTTGDQLHSGWSDFATILRAMNRNGDKQLLPYIPFLSDMANLTSAQGRIVMQQHPVGAFLDVLPGIGKVGELAVAGRDFGMLDPLTGQFKKISHDDATRLKALKDAGQLSDEAYKQALKDAAQPLPYGVREPRFWAAGRALQAGNPVKALVSATGDIIPAGFSTDLMTNVTLRQRADMVAASMGFSAALRNGLVRPYHEMNDQFKASVEQWRRDTFQGTAFENMSAKRAHDLWLGAEAFVNPHTGEQFRNFADYNNWVSSLSADERGGIMLADTLAERMRKEAISKGWLVDVPYGDVILRQTGTRPTHEVYMSVPVNSPIAKNYRSSQEWHQKVLDADTRWKQSGKQADYDALQTAKRKLADAQDRMAAAQVARAPEEWQPAMAAYIRSNVETALKDVTTKQELDSILKSLDQSTLEKDFERLMGSERYAQLKADAVNWWMRMARDGMKPLWIQTTDIAAFDNILAPRITDIKESMTVPKPYRTKAAGVYFGDTVQDIAAALTTAQVEQMRHEFAGSYLKTYILPRSSTRGAKLAEFQKAYTQATATGVKNLPSPSELFDQHFKRLDPSEYDLSNADVGGSLGDMVIDRDTAKILREMVAPNQFIQMGGKVLTKGTSLYKFAVLTGPRHFAHVAFGGLMFMMLGQPLAPLEMFRAVKIMRASAHGGTIDPKEYGVAGTMLSGLKQHYYQLGPRPTWSATGIDPTYGHLYQTGANIGQDYAVGLIHQARQQGAKLLEYIPNKLAQLEENIITMYKVSTMLSVKRRTGDMASALEQANKLYVDVNGLAPIERLVMKQIFPFYAFTRHLFRYLFEFPVDHPIRAAVLTNFAEGEQADWNSGLPRSYMTLYHLGQPNADGNILTFDLKNVNPFRSFANDWSWAGFTSSLSPFISSPLNAIGVDTLSGTTQLYPGSSYNPETGTLEATPPPGWQFGILESFVPQLGLLDHFFQLTKSTQMMALYNKDAYRKQLYNMLNVPFVPDVVNVPYEKEITEMRRFRAAQAAVTLVSKNPSSANIAALLQWNAVPFDNTLIAPDVLAGYYKRVQAALAAAGEGGLSPKAALRKPPQRKAQLQNFDVAGQAAGG